MEQFSMRLPKNTKDQLQQLAEATGRTKTYLALDAIEKYLALEAWQIGAIQDGIKDIDNGKFKDINEIKKDWEIEV